MRWAVDDPNDWPLCAVGAFICWGTYQIVVRVRWRIEGKQRKEQWQQGEAMGFEVQPQGRQSEGPEGK